MAVNPDKPRTTYTRRQVGGKFDYETALMAIQAADVALFETVRQTTTQAELIASNYNADGSSKNDPDGKLSVGVANIEAVAQVIAALSGKDPDKMQAASVDALVMVVIPEIVKELEELRERQDKIVAALWENFNINIDSP